MSKVLFAFSTSDLQSYYVLLLPVLRRVDLFRALAKTGVDDPNLVMDVQQELYSLCVKDGDVKAECTALAWVCRQLKRVYGQEHANMYAVAKRKQLQIREH